MKKFLMLAAVFLAACSAANNGEQAPSKTSTNKAVAEHHHEHEHEHEHEHDHDHGHEHDHEHEHEQLGAHVHGEVNILLSGEDGLLQVILQSAAVNFIGFEHSPKTAAEKQIIADSLEKFKQATNWLQFVGAKCNLLGSKANIERLSKDDNHAEFVATTEYSCKNLSDLTAISVNLEAHATAVESLKVHWAIGNKVGQKQLDSDFSQSIDIK